MTSTTEERLAKLTRKRLHADFKAGADWQRRRSQQRREAEAHRDGSSGPAGPARRIAPDGRVLAEFTGPIAARGIVSAPAIGAPGLTVSITLHAAPLAPAAPLIGFPAAENLRPATARKRAERARRDAGDMLISGLLDEDLRDALAAHGWLLGIDADDPRAVGEAILRGLREDLLGE